MNKKIFKIYVYPLLFFIISVAPWYLFAKLVLKIDIDHFIYQSMDCDTLGCVTNFKLFIVVLLLIIYCGCVSLSIWLEKSKSIAERERKIESLALNYGKAFIGLVSVQFILVILCATFFVLSR